MYLLTKQKFCEMAMKMLVKVLGSKNMLNDRYMQIKVFDPSHQVSFWSGGSGVDFLKSKKRRFLLNWLMFLRRFVTPDDLWTKHGWFKRPLFCSPKSCSTHYPNNAVINICLMIWRLLNTAYKNLNSALT